MLAAKPADSLELALADLKTRWTDLQVLLQDRRNKIEFLGDKKQFYDELNTLEDLLQGYARWLSNAEQLPEDYTCIQPLLDQCRVRFKMKLPLCLILLRVKDKLIVFYSLN